MKNVIEFYYNMRIDTINNKDDYYTFTVNNIRYIFKPYYYNSVISESHFRLSSILYKNIPLNKIILNKYNSPVTIIENNQYILMENKKNIPLSLSLISNISNIKIPNIEIFKNLERNNWELLWANKIDYYELQISENKKKYPLIRESFDYFVGMAENAISYLVDTKIDEKPNIYDIKVLSHNTIYNSLFDSSNIILDHKARDLAEYIKYSFWNNNKNIFYELNDYFRYNKYLIYGIRVLFSRLLYPSFYFELYDQIIIGKKEEKELSNIISRINDYEYYLYNIYIYLKRYYNIPEITWIKDHI